MDILERARRLERHLARGMSDAAKSLVRGDGVREPLELTHAIVDAVEREIQLAGRGTRVFPFNTVDVFMVAASEHARARLDAIVNGLVPLHDRITERLRAAHCAVETLEVNIHYLAKPQKHWTDPQFGISFKKVARDTPVVAAVEPPSPRLEVTVVHGAADHRTYALASARVDLGRGGDVRDSRLGLIRTNQVAFSENSTSVNRTVSRQHAHIFYDARSGQFRVHDDGSVHGTKVVRKGKTVPVPFGARGVRLQSGDEIVLGEARVRVKF
jgi:hypothetical protein